MKKEYAGPIDAARLKEILKEWKAIRKASQFGGNALLKRSSNRPEYINQLGMCAGLTICIWDLEEYIKECEMQSDNSGKVKRK